MTAHPTDLPSRDANGERMRFNIFVNHGAGPYESIFANSHTTDDRAVSAKSRSLPNKSSSIFMLSANRTARVIDIGEHHTWATKNIILYINGIIDAHVVLNFYIIANNNIATDEYILTKRAPSADSSPI
jgi:hypothetical protein